jgi:hypothetical protein
MRADTNGEHNGNARLSAEDVKRIRVEYATGDKSQLDLSCEYGVEQAHISRIVRGKAWRNV